MHVINPSGRTVEVEESNACVAFAKAGLHGWSLAGKPKPEPKPEPNKSMTSKGKG